MGHFEAPGGTGVKFNADDTNGLRDCRCGQPLLIYPYKQPGGASGAGAKNPGRILRTPRDDHSCEQQNRTLISMRLKRMIFVSIKSQNDDEFPF